MDGSIIDLLFCKHCVLERKAELLPALCKDTEDVAFCHQAGLLPSVLPT